MKHPILNLRSIRSRLPGYNIFTFSIFFLLFHLPLVSQTYYANSGSGLELITIQNGTCTSQFIAPFIEISTGNPVGTGDIAICPDGKLYVTDNSNTWEVNPATGGCILVASSATYLGIVGLGCDGNGILYGAGVDFTGGGTPLLYEIDVNAGTTTVVGTMPFTPTGDIVKYNGTWYMTSGAGLVQVDVTNPMNSILVLPGAGDVGLTVYQDQCNTLLGGSGQLLSLYDLTDMTITSLCTISPSIGGLTTIAEFSGPLSCPIEIDLDFNNSSGAPEFDFNAIEFSCITPNGVPIADSDTDIQASAPISQMSISISSGLLDPGFEFLELGSAPNIQVTGSGTPNLVLNNQGSATIADFITAVTGVVYKNTKDPVTPGQRQVTVSFTTITGDNSNNATAFIPVAQKTALQVDLGADKDICPGETILLDAGITGVNYLWSTAETTQTILVSTPGTYSVTVSNGINCPGTDEVTLNQLPVYTVSLNGTSEICQGESATLVISTDAPGPIDVSIDDNNGNSLLYTNLINGSSITVAPPVTTTYFITSVTSATLNGCFIFSSGIHSISVYPNTVTTTSARICGGESIFLEGAFQTQAGIYTDIFQSVNGCDSTVITILTVNAITTTFLNKTTCFPPQAGIFEDTLINIYGCDSVVVTTVTLLESDTTFQSETTCDPNQAGIFQKIFTNHSGCDSTVITTVVLIPPEFTYLMASTCDPGQVGTFQENLSNQFGCDSFVITTTSLLQSDTTFLFETSCNPTQTGTFQETFTNSQGCDSIIFTTISLIGADTSFLTGTSCDSNQAGTFQETFTNSQGCDSIVFTTISLIGADTSFLTGTSCDPNQAGTFQETFTNSQGCDSIVFTTISLIGADTSFLTGTSCDSNQAGTFQEAFTNQQGCDSIVFTTISLIDADTSFLTGTSCDPNQAGTFQETFTNSQGCDSIVFTTISLIGADTSFLTGTSCDPNQAGTFQETFTNQQGCDSIVFTTISLIGADTSFLTGTSCDPNQAGTFQEAFTNQQGCDSIVFTTISLIGADTSFLTGTSCDPNQAGTFQETFTNSQGCDSIVFTTISLIGADTSFLTGTSCDPNQAGTFQETFTNQQGCDSIVFTTISLIDADTSFLTGTSCDPNQAGTFQETFTNSQGCDSIVFTTISLIGADTSFLTGTSCDPNQAGTFQEAFTNQQGCDSIVFTTISLIGADTSFLTGTSCDSNQAGTFQETFTNSQGCDSIVITTVVLRPAEDCEEENADIYVPNVFSPNGDGYNDYFTLFGGGGIQIIRTLRIYNRWGEAVFEAANMTPGNISAGWDGTFKGQRLDPAVFIYWAEVELADGDIRILQGDVTLIR